MTGRTTILARAALALAVLLAVLVRLRLEAQVAFTPWDERAYLEAAGAVAREGPAEGLRAVLRAYLGEPRLWIFPPPIRYGQHLLGGLACRVGGVGFESLAALSTLASVAAVVTTAALARRLGGARAALVAVLLLGSSPLWLHLGRRALADAPYSAVALLAAWAVLAAARRDAPPWHVALAVALAAWQTAMKEGGALLLAALPVAVAARTTRADGPREGAATAARTGLLLAAAGGLAWLGFSLLVGSPWSYVRVLDAIRQAGPTNAYIPRFQGGPPWRYLVDLALLSPGLVLLAPAALAHTLRRDPRSSPRAELAWSLAALVVAYLALLVAAGAAGMGYNARYLLPLDAPLRVLVGVWLVDRLARDGARPVGVGVAAAVVVAWVAVEAWVFRRVFLERGVYDPVTDALARALGLVP